MSVDGEHDSPGDSMDIDSEADGQRLYGNGEASMYYAQANGDKSPTPPPHKASSTPPKPAYDPEECKALGNKYFKAKDYTKAVQEYTKGMLFLLDESRAAATPSPSKSQLIRACC